MPFSWAGGSVLFGWNAKRSVTVTAEDLAGEPFRELDAAFAGRTGSPAIAVGYISYDLGGYLEPAAASRHPADALPLVHFGLYDEYYSWCPRTGRAYVHRRGGPLRYDAAMTRRISAGPDVADNSEDAGVAGGLESNFSREGYIRAVERAREYIFAGDIYEVNLSQRFVAPFTGDPRALYRRLRACNPAPYAAYISMPGANILSSSPELFLRVEGGRVTTRPIKGTVRRAADAGRDAAAAAGLLASEKDNAELAMIVDLERNDLGRVCRYGSVRVAETKRIETFARVHHLVATVEGRLRPGETLGGLLAAAFPGGSITGAPKIRSMQVIDEIEPCRRGVYTGAIGYVMPGGRAEFNIAIRTVVVEDSRLSIQVGGAVTSDSIPEGEYEETLTKAEAIFQALGSGAGAECAESQSGRLP
jgi:para-aminobenzoate synthetase component 1